MIGIQTLVVCFKCSNGAFFPTFRLGFHTQKLEEIEDVKEKVRHVAEKVGIEIYSIQQEVQIGIEYFEEALREHLPSTS